MTRLSTYLFASAVLFALPTVAFAEDPDAGGEATAGAPADPSAPPPEAAPVEAAPAEAPAADAGVTYTKTTWPKAFNERPLTLAKGMIEIHADAFINLSDGGVFKPFALAPDVWYAVSDKLKVGLTHGLGLCLTGEDNGCAKVYNDVGVGALFSVKRDAKMEIAVSGSLDLVSLDPMTARLTVGGSFKYVTGQIGIYVDPAIGIGLNERDADPVTMLGGNTETLTIPVKAVYQATPELAVHLRTGLGGLYGSNPANGGALLDGFGDNFVIPVGVGALYAVSNTLDVGGEFFFPGIAGSDLATADFRAVLISGNFRL